MLMLLTIHLAWYWLLLIIVIAMVVGAQSASHEERRLDYNLEDVELDTLRALEARLRGDEKKVVAKVRSALARAKAAEQKAVGLFRRVVRKLTFWRR